MNLMVTKAALNPIARRWSVHPDGAGSGIVLNVVAPGVIDTEAVRKHLSTHGKVFTTSLL
jgi:NAD(P)-dependent dehydrogenase (short-subunit alcohol dehydrogenase family)